MKNEFDTIVPYYKAAAERWPSALTLSNLYSSLLQSYENDSIGLIDHIKSFIESVCLTILTDFGVRLVNSNPTTTQILSETWNILGLENTRGLSIIDKVISGYNKIADAINEMRNESGIISHGKDGFFEIVQKEHMRSFLLAGDSILCLIIAALDGKEPDIKYTREPYENFQRFNELIDESISCRATNDEDEKIIIIHFYHADTDNEIQLRIEPSEALFNLDREAYVEIVEISTTKQSELMLEKHPTTKIPQLTYKSTTKDKVTSVEVMDLIEDSKYDGIYKDYYPEFKNFLVSIVEQDISVEYDKLTSAILRQLEIYQFPEWKSRDVLIAKIVTTIKRILLYFGVKMENENLPENIFYWLKTNIIKSD